jgi:hypothetical protein
MKPRPLIASAFIFLFALGSLPLPVGISAAFAGSGPAQYLKKPDSWFASDEARRVAANTLSFQSDLGGWPKNMDTAAGPFSGDRAKELKATFDNGATTDELRFLARFFNATKDDRCRRAMDNPRIIGLKDSSGNMIYFHRVVGLLKHRPDWTLLIGPEEMLADAVFAGGHGGVNGGANFHPRLYVELFRAAQAGDNARVRELHAQVMRISDNLYRIGRHPSAIIKGIKCALALLGVCDDFMAEPFHRFREPERGRVRQILNELKLPLKTT